jgi:hypothetical protein
MVVPVVGYLIVGAAKQCVMEVPDRKMEISNSGNTRKVNILMALRDPYNVLWH